MPPPRSMYTFPSASWTNGPSAAVTSMGSATLTAFVMNLSFRAIAAFDFGPGGTATIFGPRSSFGVRFAMVSWPGSDRYGSPATRDWQQGIYAFNGHGVGIHRTLPR